MGAPAIVMGNGTGLVTEDDIREVKFEAPVAHISGDGWSAVGEKAMKLQWCCEFEISSLESF